MTGSKLTTFPSDNNSKKGQEHIPAAKTHRTQSKPQDRAVLDHTQRHTPLHLVESPTPEQEIFYLKRQNRLLKDALKNIENLAKNQEQEYNELVWFASNPGHPDYLRNRNQSIAPGYKIDQLHGPEHPFYSGLYSGVLATARFYKALPNPVLTHGHMKQRPVKLDEKMDITTVWEEEVEKAIAKTNEQSLMAFPNMDVDQINGGGDGGAVTVYHHQLEDNVSSIWRSSTGTTSSNINSSVATSSPSTIS